MKINNVQTVILNLFPLETTINFSSDVISALMWAKNVQLQTNTFRSNQRRRPIESILLLMQIGGKICPAPMHKLCEKVGEEIDQAHMTCYISSYYYLKCVPLYYSCSYFFKQLHNLGLPLSVYSKNMYSIIT
ncbi:hypothetical protein T12_15402 [Trichinella patagoniensis]|uniref:Uncharacterized protein n=1 Tax=Trichinella patagoniensis TaxID=990121 RepID=A0A0V0ZI72_9BILA|nr:hypothetical protein T12_15402 [Trichinella patagoniensis]